MALAHQPCSVPLPLTPMVARVEEEDRRHASFARDGNIGPDKRSVDRAQRGMETQEAATALRYLVLQDLI